MDGRDPEHPLTSWTGGFCCTPFLDKLYARSHTFLVTYVDQIEPRLTAHRAMAPATAVDALIELCLDLQQELAARLRLLTPDDLAWQPHPDANSPGVTAWHVARWLDVLATRAFTGCSEEHELWRTEGWRDITGYNPAGVGYLGLGTLTGYTPQEMRAVPLMSAKSLETYLGQSAEQMVARIRRLSGQIHESREALPSPYQIISSTLQGSFGHLGEIDALVALRARLGQSFGGPAS